MFLTGKAIRTTRTTVRCLAFIFAVGLVFSITAAQAQDSVIVGPPDDPYVVYGSGLPTTYTPSKSADVLSSPPVDAVNITLIDPSMFPEVCTSIEILDSLGNPIPGFDVDSLCVYEDGIRIESFEVVETPIDSCFTSIALVIDVSGSMDNGDKIDSAKAAAHAFVDNMDLYDRVAIVKFSDCFEVVQDFTSDKALLHTKITALVAGGFTAAFDGIWKGVDITTGEFGSKAVIALSDGMENRSWLCPGGTDGLLDGFADDSTIIVGLARAASIPIYTISLGASFDPKYLEALALGSGGFHSHAPTAGEIRDIYETIKFRLCSRYVICYTSPDLPDTCHTLEVCRRNAAGICAPCDTAEYCEPKPPRIKLLVQAECHPANSDLQICARVNDSDTPRDSLDVKLFYRMSDVDPYSSVAMVHTYLDTFCYVIPGALFPSCLMDGVQFYGTASDGRTTVADPTGAPFDHYTIDICKGDPPICDVPDDITIFQCDPTEVCLPVGCLDVTGARTGDPTLISGPGAIVDGEWCYTPSGSEVVSVTVQCTGTCGQTCEGSFTVTFDMNDAPVCNPTSNTGPPLCVPAVHVVTFETSDADDNLTECVVYGDGELLDHSWQVVAPQPGQTVSARIVCYDECRDSCWIDIEFTFPDPVPPVCDLPENTTIVLCAIEADSLPVSATADAVCVLIDGPGELRNGYWVYEPNGSEQVSVTVECRTECDTCGGTFEVTYEVNEPPVLTCQGSGVAECSDDPAQWQIPEPQIDDENPATVVLSPPVWDTIPGNCENRYTVEITWIGTDECGAADTCTDVIEVEDTTPPYFLGCPDPITPECGSAYVMPPPTAEDNCDDDVEVTIVGTDSIPGRCLYEYTRIIVWEAMDNCGNVDTCLHVYNIVDNTPPMIECPDPLTYECDTVPASFPEPTATDLCDPNPVVRQIGPSTLETGECPQSYHLTIAWEAMDACGNADTCMQEIDVVDTTPPEMTCSPDTSIISCDTDVIPAPPDATDNCDPAPVVTMGNAVRTPDPDCPQGWFMVVPWEAEDACGNVAACTTYFKAVDDLPPTITCPPPSSQYCGSDTPPIPEPGASDNCDLDPTVWLERIDTIEGACPQAYTANLVWMAEDDCGNVDSCKQVIEYYDDQPPDCDGHPPLVYSCDDVPAVFPLPLALDACDPDPLVLLVDRDSTGDACSYTLSLEYEYRDACGNSSFHTQIVEVQDTTPPYFVDCPEPMTPECGTAYVLPPPTAEDNCDDDVEVTIVGTDSIPGSCLHEYTRIIVWEAMDNCGNTDTCRHVYNIVDNTPPFIECPPPETYECDAVPAEFPEPTATDLCDPNPVITEIGRASSTTAECPQGYHLTIMWEAMDACGNADTCTQVIDVVDTTPPVCTVPEDATLFLCEPGAQLCLPVSATDNCDPDPQCRVLSGPGSVDLGQWCYQPTTDEVVTVVIACKDDCGNECQDEFTVTIEVNEPPVCETPNDTTIYTCRGDTTTFCWSFFGSDPDDNFSHCIWRIGGGEKTDVLTMCLQPGLFARDTSFYVASECFDACGLSCYDSFNVAIVLNDPPVCEFPDDITFFACEPGDTLWLAYGATDPEDNLDSCTIVDGPGGLTETHWYYVVSVETEFDVSLACFDSCGTTCEGSFHVVINLNDPPFVEAPDDTTIFLCEPGDTICLGPWPQIDLDGNIMNRWVNFGWMDPPSVCFVADTPGVYIIDDCLEDSCGAIDCDTAIITVIFNSPPVCEVPNDTTIVLCEITEVCLPLGTSDPDGNLAYCEIVGITCMAGDGCKTVGGLDQWCYTPQGDETVNVTIYCVDSCGAECESSFSVTFDIVAPPVCEFPADTFIMVCDSGEIITLPYSVDDPDGGLDSCFITSGPGALVNGAWEYETSVTEKVCVGVACVGVCGESCIDSFCVTIRVNEPPFVESPGDTAFWLCKPGDTVCLGPWPQIDFDYNIAERFVHFGWMDPPSVCFVADTPGVYIIDDCLTDSCGLTDCDTAYVTIRINTPPVCYVPNDTTITMCAPGEVSLPYDVFDADDNLRECVILDGPGILDNGMWVYTPPGDTIVCVTIECTDECETRCASEFCVTFEVNDPPVCEVPEDTIIFQCEPTEVKLPVSALDEDDNLVGCELIDGPGKIEDGYWIYTPLGDEVICNIVRCIDECGDSCVADFCVIFEINDPPVCELPRDTTISVCEVKEICLPVGLVGDWKNAPGSGGDVRIPSRDKDDGSSPSSLATSYPVRKSGVPTVCTVLSGPGYISDGLWCYTPPERDTTVTVTIECRDTCDATCEGSFTIDFDINEPPVCQFIDLVPPPPCPSPAAIIPIFFSSHDPDGDQTTCTLYVDAGNVTMGTGFVEIEHIPGDSVDFTIVCRDVCRDSCVLTMAFRFPKIQPVVCPDISPQEWFRCDLEADSVLVGGSCEIIGDVRGILRNGWWVYTPTGDESFKVDLMCMGLCDTCYTSFAVDIDINEPPTCWIQLDADTAHYWFCDPEEICIFFGGSDPDENMVGCELVSGPGAVYSSDGRSWCYTPQPATDEIFEVTIRCVDECGAESFCSFFVDIDMNQPPICESPNDTTIFLCEPTQICLPIGGATDPDNNLEWCYWIGDPDKDNGWCYFAQTDETVPVITRCEDVCGAFCEDTFYVTFEINEDPICVTPNDTTIFLCEPDTVCIFLESFDPDGNLESCDLQAPIPYTAIEISPGRYAFCSDVAIGEDGSAMVPFRCYDSCGAFCEDSFRVTIEMNKPPVCAFQTPVEPVCTPPIQFVPFTSTDPEGGDVNCSLEGPGELVDGGWQYEPTPGEQIAVTITCTDECGATCTIGWNMTFPARVPPVCEIPNDTTIVTCIGNEIALPVGAGVGATCEIVGGQPGTLSGGYWRYTMTQEETVNVSILCVSANGCDSCSGSFAVTLEKLPPPTLTFDGGSDQSFFLCQSEEICLPYTAADGTGGNMYHVTIVSGPGTVDAGNDRICFTPTSTGTDTIIARVEDPCDESRDTVIVHVTLNSDPICSLPNDTAIASCDASQICLPVSASDPDGNLTGCAVTGGPGQIIRDQWCYTPTASGPVTVTVTCTDDCGATCSGSFTVDFDLQGAPPVCNVPNDTTILLCDPVQVCLPYSATDPDGGAVTCEQIDGPGSLVDGHWCYTPPADQEVTVTIRCSDDCGNYCEGTFSVLFDINDAPKLTVPEEVSEVVCGTEEICIPITATDQNDNLTGVVVVEGPGEIDGDNWCYTPPPYDQTVDVRIRATDACGRTALRWMRVNIDYNAVPTCDLPPNGRMILCEPGQVCLTFNEVDPASVGLTCSVTDGPGTIQGGQWCYNATTPAVVTFTMRCTNPCGDVCTQTRTYTFEIDPNECDPGPAAVQTPIVRVTGDLDNSGSVDVLDLVLLTRQLNRPVTPALTTPAVTTAAVRRSNAQADVNCDGSVTQADVVYLAAFLFEGGPAPCSSE